MHILAILALLVALASSCKSDAPKGEAKATETADTVFTRVDQDLARFDAEVAKLRKAGSEATSATPEQAVSRELKNMVQLDQYLREQSDMSFTNGYSQPEQVYFQTAFSRRWEEIDAGHTRRVRDLVHTHGWITIGRFGETADQNAWLLVQHADADLAFQKEVLALLAPLAKSGESNPENYAYLYDRVATAENRPQRYGTQGSCVGPGKWEPGPLEDEAEIDNLRASVGLIRLASYKEMFINQCH